MFWFLEQTKYNSSTNPGHKSKQLTATATTTTFRVSGVWVTLANLSFSGQKDEKITEKSVCKKHVPKCANNINKMSIF